MVEGRQYLLSVIEYYQRAIAECRLDDVLQDIALGLWRLDPSVAGMPPETVSLVEARLEHVHGRVLCGSYADALRILHEVHVSLVEAEEEGQPPAA